MQIIPGILLIENGSANWVADNGASNSTPVFTLGVLAGLSLDLRVPLPLDSENVSLPAYPFSELDGLGLRFVMDVDYNQATVPPLKVASGITLSQDSTGHTRIAFQLPDTNYVAMRTHLGVGERLTFKAALIGTNASGKDVFYAEFPLVFRNHIDLDDAAEEPDTEDPSWLPTVQAIIREIVEDMADDLKGDPGDDGDDGAAGKSAYEIWLEAGHTGTEAEFLAFLKGDTGSTGATGAAGPANSLSVGTVTTLPAGSNATVEITGTAPNQTANFGIPRGAQGAGATFAYNITSDANSANWHPTMLATDRYWRISIDNGVSWSIARPLEQASVAPVARFSKIAQATNPTWQTPTDQGDGTSLLPSNCIYFRIKVEGRPWTEPALVGIPRDATTYPGVSSVADMTAQQLATWTATLKNDGGIRVAYAAPNETTGQQPDAEDADAWHAIIQTGDCYIRFSSLYGALRHVWTVSGGELASLQVATTGPEWHDTPLEDDKYMKLSLDGGTSWYGYFKIAMDADDLELVLDSTPTQGSSNGVTSGGVYAAIQAATGGQAVDLSNYYTKSQADTLLQTMAPASHAHTQSDINGLSDALAGKAAFSHSHAQSDITGLSTTLAGKQDALPSGTVGQVLKLTENGPAWDDETGGSGGSGSGSYASVDSSFVENSTNPVQSKVIQEALASLQTSISSRLPVVASEADMLDYAVGLDRAKEFGLCVYSGAGEASGYDGDLLQGHLYLVIGPNLTAGSVTQSSASGTRSTGGVPSYTYRWTTTDLAYEIETTSIGGMFGSTPDWNGTYTDQDGNGVYFGPTVGVKPDGQGRHFGHTYYYTYNPSTQTLTRHHYDNWTVISGANGEDPTPTKIDDAYDEVIDGGHFSPSRDVSETTVTTQHEEEVVMYTGLELCDPMSLWADLWAALFAIHQDPVDALFRIWYFDITPFTLLRQKQTVFMLPGLPDASAAYAGCSALLTTDGRLYQCRGAASNGTTTYAWHDVTPWISSAAQESRLDALEALVLGTLTVSHTGTAPTGAQWSVDGGTTWHDFGASVKLAPATYTVTFKTVEGYTSPSSQSVTLTAGGTQSVSVAYTATTTAGTVTLTFSGTVPTGAGWTIDGQSYTSGDTATLSPGTYAITYVGVEGYDSPSTPTSVTVAAGDTLTLSAEYTEQQSSGPAYTVSGSSYDAANGPYALVDGLNGRNNSPVFSNGTWYLAYGYDGDNEEMGWALTTVTPSSSLYFNHPPQYWRVSSDASAPPTSGWSGGVTVTQGS